MNGGAFLHRHLVITSQLLQTVSSAAPVARLGPVKNPLIVAPNLAGFSGRFYEDLKGDLADLRIIIKFDQSARLYGGFFWN